MYSLIILLVILYIIYIGTKYFKNETFINYYKCNNRPILGVLNNVLIENDIYKNNDKWDLYIPCTYTNSDVELNKLSINNKDQSIFAISNCDKFVSKNGLWANLVRYYGKEFLKNYLPYTYITSDSSDMRELQDNFNKNKLYILKKNIQKKQGIKLTNKLGDILNAKYNGYVIAQEYLKNTKTILGRKVNLRVYLLIRCQNDIQNWYIYKNGKCLYSNKKYNSGNITDLEQYITSSSLKINMYENLPLTLVDLKEYIGLNNYNYLFNKIKYITTLCKECFKDKICNNKNLKQNLKFQLFGMDFIYDNNYDPYLLEINKGPEMSYINLIDKKLKQNVYNDIFKLVYNGDDTHFIEL